MPLRVANLVLRQTKGSELTTAEGDQNWKTLRDFSNALSDLVGVALNTDGTLKDDSVEESDIKARSVTATKLGLAALPFFSDQGSPSNYAIYPDPAPTEADYEDGMVFFIRVNAGNTGASTLQVGNLGAKPIYKLGGQELSAGDILGRSVIAVAYYAGAFHLVSGAGGTSTGGGGTGGDTTASGSFSGILRYDPAAVPLPAFGTSKVFAHALNMIPDEFQVLLQCATAELGFLVGDSIPLYFVVDSTGKRAFAVSVSTSAITVRQTATPAMVARANDGGAGHTIGTLENITPASWALKATAGRITSAATQTFPALDYQVGLPNGALSYGKDLFVFSSGRHSGKNFLTRIDLLTNNVSIIDSAVASTADNVGERYRGGPLPAGWQGLHGLDLQQRSLWKLPLQNPGGAGWSLGRLEVEQSPAPPK